MDPNETDRLTCPTIQKVCELPESAKDLPNNITTINN